MSTQQAYPESVNELFRRRESVGAPLTSSRDRQKEAVRKCKIYRKVIDLANQATASMVSLLDGQRLRTGLD